MVLQDGQTALHGAAHRGDTEVIKMLVNYGVAVDIQDNVIVVMKSQPDF